MQLPPVSVAVEWQGSGKVNVYVGGVPVEIPASALASVKAIDEGQIYRNPPWECFVSSVPLSETYDWSLEFLGIPKLWSDTRGEGVKVCVLDTGCDTSHPDLAVTDAKDFTNSLTGELDHNSHGTWCCSMIGGIAGNNLGIAGIANKASLYSGKVLGDSGSGTDATIERGMLWAMSLDVDIVSMSLGGGRMSERLHAVFQEFLSPGGKFIFAASGNDGAAVNYPGAWPECIAVGAVDRNGRLTRFTSRGPQLAILAPGQDMLSAIPVSMGSYGTMTGTSMACPVAAAIGALALAKDKKHGGVTPIKTTQQMREHLQKTAVNKGDGYGLIDPAKFLAGFDLPPVIVPPVGPGIEFEIPYIGKFIIRQPAVAGDIFSLARVA